MNGLWTRRKERLEFMHEALCVVLFSYWLASTHLLHCIASADALVFAFGEELEPCEYTSIFTPQSHFTVKVRLFHIQSHP